MALRGIKVLDLTRLLPGPLCGQFLTQLGATVVKLEGALKNDKDYVRDMKPLFESLNGGKKAIAVDIRTPIGQETIRRIAKHFDVLIEGSRPGVMKRLGLDYETIKQINERIIYCSISGYGATGPLSQKAGHDINYLALSGLLKLSGKESETPPLIGFQSADAAGAMQATIGILASIIERQSTRQGQFIDVSLCESAMTLALPSISYAAAGMNQQRGAGLLDGGRQNYSIYATKDGNFLSVGALEDHFWAKICGVFDRNDLRSQQDSSEVKRIFASKTMDEWIEIFKDVDACIEPILSPLEALNLDQHVERNVLLSSTAKKNGTPQIRITPRLSNHSPTSLTKAPLQGEHTREVLSDAGFSDEEIYQLSRDGIVAATTQSMPRAASGADDPSNARSTQQLVGGSPASAESIVESLRLMPEEAISISTQLSAVGDGARARAVAGGEFLVQSPTPAAPAASVVLPVATQWKPYTVAVEAGKVYWWCSCGLSQKQPFCDGSHKGTQFRPIKVEPEQDAMFPFCGCRESASLPRCDGKHKLAQGVVP